ncbi:hypothetical protein K438DRAFT_2032803 [Mycena galopus ATCC 62051]|nr:hypothetical protein K438DRAFT_2032803 [Mycena galopus ATCC 62051]
MLGLSRLVLAVRNEGKGQTAAAKLAPFCQGGCRHRCLEAEPVRERLGHGLCRARQHALSVWTSSSSTRASSTQARTKRSSKSTCTFPPPSSCSPSPRPSAPSPTSRAPSPSCHPRSLPAYTSAALDRPGNINPLDRMFVSKLLGQFSIADLARGREAKCVSFYSDARWLATTPSSPASRTTNHHHRPHRLPPAATVNGQLARRRGARMITHAAMRGDETHVRFLLFQKMHGTNPLHAGARKISERFWQESMAELAFANPEQLKEVSGASSA